MHVFVKLYSFCRHIRDDIDYEAKFSSLRKENDKDRHRKDFRDYRHDDYYYGRRYVYHYCYLDTIANIINFL